MSGIHYVTDENGRKVAVRIDLTTHGELWEDFHDALISQEREGEQSIPFGPVKTTLTQGGKLNG